MKNNKKPAKLATNNLDNVEDLRLALTEVFRGVVTNNIPIEKAKTLVATSNSILNTAALQLEQNKFLGVEGSKRIPFLESKK